jgi:predicted SAM-dependent methyltransferase
MKLIIGAGGKTQSGWVSTEQGQLDFLVRDDFARVLGGAVGFECILSEHVLEHLSYDDVFTALKNCYDFLASNGRLRIAVPDGFHPDLDYIEYVRPGGSGAGADTHQMLFNYVLLKKIMETVGFRVELLEWWDENGQFHGRPWNELDGNIERCLASDPRNVDGEPHYTSLIVDGIKDTDESRPHLKNAFEFVERNDVYKVSPFNRKKTTTFYELARLAPAGGLIVELGSYHGIGTAALWYGAMDGNRCNVVSVDAYADMRGWANEPYTPNDMSIWKENMQVAKINPELRRGDSEKMAQSWKDPISLLVHDLGSKNRMPKDVIDWERHIIVGGSIALRDIDDYSMGTGKAISNLMYTGRWGNIRNWEAFITSIERIA